MFLYLLNRKKWFEKTIVTQMGCRALTGWWQQKFDPPVINVSTSDPVQGKLADCRVPKIQCSRVRKVHEDAMCSSDCNSSQKEIVGWSSSPPADKAVGAVFMQMRHTNNNFVTGHRTMWWRIVLHGVYRN